MALTPRDSDAFLREVDEELRRDQMLGIFQRYGKLIIAAVVLFLAGVGGYLLWQNHTRNLIGKQAENFTAILSDVDSGKVRGGDPRIDKLIKEGGEGYQTQALLLKAGLAAQAGKPGEAIGLYRRIVADNDLPQVYRDAALVRQTALEYDQLQPAAVIARLKGFALPGNPWFGSAGEMVGLAYINQGKPQLATPIFVGIAKDKNVPAGIRQRANEVALSLGQDPGIGENAGGAVVAKE